ncbi:MAG: hypothetical protein HC779_00720 [Phyllobacteriaceae bacterium]|nr:hypothetical protein [Phyllobacteriaceae bacterium]
MKFLQDRLQNFILAVIGMKSLRSSASFRQHQRFGELFCSRAMRLVGLERWLKMPNHTAGNISAACHSKLANAKRRHNYVCARPIANCLVGATRIGDWQTV